MTRFKLPKLNPDDQPAYTLSQLYDRRDDLYFKLKTSGIPPGESTELAELDNQIAQTEAAQRKDTR